MTNESLRTILVATDFSENARVAVRWAVRAAKLHDASLVLLHVVNIGGEASLPQGAQEKITRSLETTLDGLVRQSGVEGTGSWRFGKPWEIISSEAQGCDLVVIGARGRTPHTVHLLGIGSTADRVLRMAPVPVLTVHTEDSPRERPLRRVLVPTDFSESASQALSAAVNLLRPTVEAELEITLMHAWEPLIEYADSYSATILPPNPYVGTQEQAREMLEALANRTGTDVTHVNAVVRCDYPARAIAHEAEAIDADLIAMGTHGHSGLSQLMLGSVAERVVRRVHCPVLSLGPVATKRLESESAVAAIDENESAGR